MVEDIVERRVEEMDSEVGNDVGNEVGKDVGKEVVTGAGMCDPRASWTVNRGRAFKWESSRSLRGFALQLACISNRIRVLDPSGRASKHSKGRGSTAGWGTDTISPQDKSLSRCAYTPSMLYVLSSNLLPKVAAPPTLRNISV